VCIDFTASNGECTEEHSYHFIHKDGSKKNQYEQAIDSVVKILEPYAGKDQFTVLGFGGIPKFIYDNDNKVSHAFNLAEDEEENITGLDSLLNLYKKKIEQIILNGPTYFTPLLERKLQEMKE